MLLNYYHQGKKKNNILVSTQTVKNSLYFSKANFFLVISSSHSIMQQKFYFYIYKCYIYRHTYTYNIYSIPLQEQREKVQHLKIVYL